MHNRRSADLFACGHAAHGRLARESRSRSISFAFSVGCDVESLAGLTGLGHYAQHAKRAKHRTVQSALCLTTELSTAARQPKGPQHSFYGAPRLRMQPLARSVRVMSRVPESVDSPPVDAAIKKLRAQGLTYRRIADVLDVSLGTVSGKVYRLGLCQPRELIPLPNARDEIRCLHNEGKSRKEIANELGLTYYQVWRVLAVRRTRPRQPRKQVPPPNTRDEIRRLYSKGKTRNAIANELGLTYFQVWRVLSARVRP